MGYLFFLSLWIAFSIGLTSASPLVGRSLKVRSPLSNDDFSTDWPTNVVMVGGDQTYGLWVPEDGNWYDMSTLTCLGVPADVEGPCNSITIDQIGVVAGYGPCSFAGADGYASTLDGDSGDGYYTVGPPQTISLAMCGS